ncbi:uncharacterized protein FTOL_11160 [Fusarium torulosum]|uniref:Uncharacterized protein n=1 Tax=Fusarium torulosum TaxID=33205 RepID=A0AAE8SN06_9HYPO|nr:uncharacterized protein FTOL_11160 [Fusarium torulosum]
MPPPIPPFEPQVGIALMTRPPIYHGVHYEPPLHCDLAVNTLPTEMTAPYYCPTVYDKIAAKKPSYTGLNNIEENPTTSGLSSGTASPTQPARKALNLSQPPCITIPTPYLRTLAVYRYRQPNCQPWKLKRSSLTGRTIQQSRIGHTNSGFRKIGGMGRI